MSNTVEWKVEALTDGRNWSDISSYVQSLNINIGNLMMLMNLIQS